jgi:acetyl esterase
MPLDPEAKAFLDQAAKNAPTPPTEQTPQLAREQMNAAVAMLGPPEPVARVRDVSAPGPAGSIPVRIYDPGKTGPLPVLVYFHGGGFVVGSIDTHDGYCRALANASGMIIASVDYRLAPEYRFPASPEDAYAATAWIARNAAEFGADPKRVAVGGDSAGGNLAAVVALMSRDRGGPVIKFQVLIYPITDWNFDTPSYRENADGYFLTRDSMIWFGQQYLTKESDADSPYASPLRAKSLADLPPAFVMTAEYDPLRDEGEAYAKRLTEEGVPTELKRYHGMIHGFVRRLRLMGQARTALADVAAALKKALA